MTFRCQFHTDPTRPETQCVQDEEPGGPAAHGSHLHRNALGGRWRSVPTPPSVDMEDAALDAYSIVVAEVSDRGDIFTNGDHRRALRAAMAAALRRTPLAVRHEDEADDGLITIGQAAEIWSSMSERRQRQAKAFEELRELTENEEEGE